MSSGCRLGHGARSAPTAALSRLLCLVEACDLAKALRELGRIERAFFSIERYSGRALRRRCLAGPNKGGAAHKRRRAVLFHERGEIRNRFSSLRLVTLVQAY